MGWRVLMMVVGVSMVGGARGVAQEGAEDLGELQRRLVARLTGWSDQGGQTVPFSRSTPAERREAASYLAAALSARGLDVGRHRYRLPNINALVDLLLPPYRGTNVYVEIPATTTSTEYVIVGAHYDSEFRSPGAIDNASGTAVVFATALQVHALATRARNFLFVFFDQEEDDEVGSRAFAGWLIANEYAVHSVHVIDLAGWDERDDEGVDIQSPASHLEPLYRDTADDLSIPLTVIPGASSDNKSFMAADLPAVGVFQTEIHPQLHRETDTYDVMDFDYLASMTRLVSAVMTRLAQP